MGSFNDFLDAEFRPPRNWSLNSSLKFKSETLTKQERELLVECGIQVTKTTSTITVPKGYITDLASGLAEVGGVRTNSMESDNLTISRPLARPAEIT